MSLFFEFVLVVYVISISFILANISAVLNRIDKKLKGEK